MSLSGQFSIKLLTDKNIRTLQEKLLSVNNARAVSLALLLFVYPILVLSTFSIRYTELIHRVTTGRTFSESLLGSTSADSLGALGFLLLFACLAFRSTRFRLASVAIFAAGIILYLTGSSLPLQAIGIATLPSLGVLLSIGALPVARRNNDSGNKYRRTGTKFATLLLPLRVDAQRVVAAFLVIVIILEIGAVARWATYPFMNSSEIYGEDPSWRFAEIESALFNSLGLLSPSLVVLIAFSFLYKWYIFDILKRIARAIQGSDNNNNGNSIQNSFKNKNGPETPESMPPLASADHKEHQKKLFKSANDAKVAKGSVVMTSASRGRSHHPEKASTTDSELKNYLWIVILSAAVVIAPLLMIYPHLPGINPNESGVSTDERYYVNWMSTLRTPPADSGDLYGSATWTDTILNAFTVNKGDRPVTLLLILAIANLTGLPDLLVIRFLPVALAPALVFANYMFVRYAFASSADGGGGKNRLRLYASLGALFAVFSPQIVIGQYSGLLANWLALVAAYFAFYFLIKGWDSQSGKQMILSFVSLFSILAAMMLVHLYTWAHLLAVILLFAGISFIFSRKSAIWPKTKVIVMVAIVATSFLIDYSKSLYFETPAAAESDSNFAAYFQSEGSEGRLDRLYFTMSTYVGGLLSNPALLLLAIIWMVVKADASKALDRLMLCMFFISAIPITFGSVEFQTRVLYNIPFHIPALLLVAYVLQQNKFQDSSSHHNQYYYRAIFVIAIVAVMATYALRAMANLYLELPDGIVLGNEFLLP